MTYAKPHHTLGVHLRSFDTEDLPVKVGVTYFEGERNTNGEWFSLEIAGVTFFVSRDQLAQISKDVFIAACDILDSQEVPA